MACMSSVAETTGNSNARTQARAKKRRLARGTPSARREDFHSRKAGTISKSQIRLSSSSMTQCSSKDSDCRNQESRMPEVYRDPLLVSKHTRAKSMAPEDLSGWGKRLETLIRARL